MTAVLAFIFLISFLSPVAWAQGTDTDVVTAPSPTPSTSPSETPATSVADGETGEDVVTPSPLVVTIEAGDVWFSPTEVSIEAGQEAVLALTGVGLAAHNLIIDELGIQLNVGPGITSEVNLSEVPPGTYTFYCAIYGHARAGMVGTLTIGSPMAIESPMATGSPETVT